MANTDTMQVRLSTSRIFLARIKAPLIKAALDKRDDPKPAGADTDPAVVAWKKRTDYANAVLLGPDQQAAVAAPKLALSGTVLAKDTVYDWESEAVDTMATEGDLFSQINAQWDTLAGV